MLQALLILYALAAGFVFAGFASSFYQLVTNEPPRFRFEWATTKQSLVSIFLCIFCGPFIIMRQAIRGRIIERRPIGWLFAGAAIAAGWSLCTGILVTDLILHVSQGFA